MCWVWGLVLRAINRLILELHLDQAMKDGMELNHIRGRNKHQEHPSTQRGKHGNIYKYIFGETAQVHVRIIGFLKSR